MSGIALGVPVFCRTDALRRLLKSTPEYVSSVYIADNGELDERGDLYSTDWPFELEVIDVPYDAGIGPCRHAIGEAVSESYLWVGDNDMEFLRRGDLSRLRDILEANPSLGGVSGWLNEDDTVRSGARNLFEHNGTVFKTVRGTPTVEVNPLPFARFDMIPQCGLFRTEIFDDYAYDPDIFNSEHLDFFYGHKQLGKWDFASTPAVVIKHNRNIDPEYRESKRGSNRIDFELMQEKWGFDDVQIGQRPDWMSTRERSALEQGFDVFRRATPPRVWIPVRNAVRRVS